VLKLTRKTQQAVVVHPTGEPQKPLVIRVVEALPGISTLAFDGAGYSVIRVEIFNDQGNETNERYTETK
jgi:hypothetical protein